MTMTNDKIIGLLEMIEPPIDPPCKGGLVSYETAKEWADELIELRNEKDKTLEFISKQGLLILLWTWMDQRHPK